MSKIVYLVSEEKIKAFTQIHENVRPKDILPFVLQAQDMYLQEAIGTLFYNSIKDEVEAGSVSAINAAFLDDFGAPYIMNAAIYLMLPWQWSKMRNKGVLKGTSEETDSIDLKDLTFLRETARTNMEFYRERLRRELQINMKLYPDWMNAQQQNLQPNKKADYSRGMAIPRRGSKTMNQQFGRSLETQGDTYWPGGCDECDDKYGPIIP